MSTTRFDVMAVSTAAIFMTLAILLTLLCLPTALGTTRICEDGLLIAKPCRRPRLLPWSEIDSIRIDAVSYGKTRGATMGLRAVMNGKGRFLPGALTSNPDLWQRVKALEEAWSRATADTDGRSSAAHPTMKRISTFPEKPHATKSEGAIVTEKADPNKNRARSRRRSNHRP